MYCEIMLVQHALTQWNVEGKCQGHTDVPLNEEGWKMAYALAKRLEHEQISTVYTSDLKRAYQTALPFIIQQDIPLYREKQLREARWKNQQYCNQYLTLPFSVDNEEEEDVCKRAKKVMRDIAQKHMGERILVISHGGLINRFMKYVHEKTGEIEPTYQKIRMAINYLKYEKDKWFFLQLNDVSHLEAKNAKKILDNG